MDQGTYSAASAGLAQFRRLEVQNNNLANFNTVGFKRQILVNETQDFEQTLAAIVPNDPYAQPDHERFAGVVSTETRTDFSPGPIKDTGNPLDVALRDPNDFFVINGAEGPLYTRAGNFTLNSTGEMVTLDGAQVLGDGGPITANGPGVSISPDGSVRAGPEPVGQLQIVRIENPQDLVRVGDSRFKLGDGQAPPVPVEARVVPQSLEMSNVSPVSSMIDVLVTSRAFEAYTKAATTIDQMNQASITQVGRRQ